MPEYKPSAQFLENWQKKISAGLPEGVRREIARRKEQGIPHYISRNGIVEVVLPDGTIHPVEPQPGAN